MQWFRTDIQLMITKTFLRIWFFVLIMIGMQKRVWNNLWNKLEDQEIVAMTQSVHTNTPKKIFNIYETNIYRTTLDILIYKICTICKQKNNHHDNILPQE